ncbi:MAG TPA: ATP-binding protein [Vicinamibacterales bacterium]|jgi:signal transduction histidine kinase|nr:ATP-binding protein [Vicinamibacterales bacterium]
MNFLRSLSNRIFVAGALLAVAPLGVAIWSVTASVTGQAEKELRRGLEEAATLLDENRDTQFDHFVREARLIADLPRLKAIVELNDPPTATDVAQFYRETIAADVLILTHRSGRLLAHSGGAGLAPDTIAARPAIRDALTGQPVRGFWGFPGGVMQVVTVPIEIVSPATAQREVFGTLTVGFSLDEAAARRFKALTNSDVAFAIDGAVKAATLPSADWPSLAGLSASGPPTVRLGDEEFSWLARPLATGAHEGSPTALILRSRSERLRFLRAIYTALGVTAIAAVLAATLLSYAVARTVTRPLGVITATMRETAATGDLTRRISLPRSAIGPLGDDEDAQLLASTFNSMTESIARFQRDASQRERLSALGRLSTVVAHEIRNPLMIIKASLRTLRRDEVAPPDLKRAVSDIDEETGRLNRIVTDVLDFAKPIKFDLAPADINALCRDAARAASQDESAALTLTLTLEPSLAPIVTDAERLRLVLINILTNARHAMEGTEAGTAAKPSAIELRTVALPTGRIAIHIRDRGVGIKAEDLPRIFEPYYTTKRTGSGLGLAIARNVVEGLGGTIAVTSRTGVGTEITIELPTTAVLQPVQA